MTATAMIAASGTASKAATRTRGQVTLPATFRTVRRTTDAARRGPDSTTTIAADAKASGVSQIPSRSRTAEMMDALNSNFVGPRGEEVRQMCLNQPKFGNDIDEADLAALGGKLTHEGFADAGGAPRDDHRRTVKAGVAGKLRRGHEKTSDFWPEV